MSAKDTAIAGISAGETEVVRVLPAAGALDREFDYLMPYRLLPGRPASVGDRVRIPLGPRRVGGWVIAKPATPATEDLKEVLGWRGLGPSADLVELSAWASWRWAGPRRLFLQAASPPRIVSAAESAREGLAEEAPLPSWAPEGLAEAWEARFGIIRVAPGTGRLPYLKAVLAASAGQILVLVPTEAGASALAAGLRGEGVSVALLPDGWAMARAGARVIVGTRSAAWAPAGQLGTVVVLDCHDRSWKETRSPTWEVPALTLERCRRAGARWIGLSCCPTLALSSLVGVFTTSRGSERRGWAPLEVVDMTEEDPRNGIVSTRLAAIARQASAASPLAVVYNLKGRARLLGCSKCKALARCEACGAALVGSGGDSLSCLRCGLVRPVVCGSCGSTKLATLRSGVTRLAEQLALLGVEVSEGETAAPVMVGTEALLHRRVRASVVVMADFDQELLRAHFGAAESALALLGRASRAVGGRAGRVVVQTRLASHPVLQAAMKADPEILARSEEPLRRQLALPPFAALAMVSGEHAEEWLSPLGEDVGGGRSGPGRDGSHGAVELSQIGEGRLVLRAGDTQVLCDALASLGRRPSGVRVEVDPQAV